MKLSARREAGGAPAGARAQERLFAGSDAGGGRAAMIYAAIETARLNGLDPYACLAAVFGRIGEYPFNHIAEPLPWNWRPGPSRPRVA